MEPLATKAVAALVLPSGGNIVLAVIGFGLWRRARALAATLIIISIASLLIVSMLRVGDALHDGLDSFEPRLPGATVADEVGAIVVLSGGWRAGAREYGGETVSEATLVRLRYGARLQRETGLPLLVSGGGVFGDSTPEAHLGRDVLEDEFGVPVRWLEDHSRTTAENARVSRPTLVRHQVLAKRADCLSRGFLPSSAAVRWQAVCQSHRLCSLASRHESACRHRCV